MAVVTSFEKKEHGRPKAHPTHVVGRWSVLKADGRVLLQIDTTGSEDRENPGNLSQTLQLDRAAAEQLCAILKREFDLE